MNFEPGKLFVGLVDFFAVLMPGAVLVYFGADFVPRPLLGAIGSPLTDLQTGLVFFVASYLAGHLVFLVGSYLDEYLYDWLRKRTRWGQIQRLSRGKPLSPRWLRRLACSRLFFGPRPDEAVM